MWPYNPETKAKFAQKNMKKKGYTEGIDQIENTPEIAAVEGEEEVVVKKVEKLAAVEKVETPKSTKRKAAEMEANVTPARKSETAAESGADSEKEEKLSRSGRVLKPKKFGDTSAATMGSPKPDPTITEGEQPPAKKQARSSLRGGKKEEEAVKEEEVKPEQPAEPRKMWVKVKNTDDLIEINP